MYQHLTLEQIKTFLKQTRQDIVITKISRDIVTSEFHLIGIIEFLKTIKSLNVNSISLSPDQYFWLKSPDADILVFLSMIVLSTIWYSYQNSLTDLYEIERELSLEKDKRFFIKK